MKEIGKSMESILLHQKIIVLMHVLLLLGPFSTTSTLKDIRGLDTMAELCLLMKSKLSAKREHLRHLILTQINGVSMFNLYPVLLLTLLSIQDFSNHMIESCH